MSECPDKHNSDNESQEENGNSAGTAKFKTIKAGCGIRFDPDTLSEEAGFDFSAAERLKQVLPDEAHNPPDNSDI
jgi:hypothetical protein